MNSDEIQMEDRIALKAGQDTTNTNMILEDRTITFTDLNAIEFAEEKVNSMDNNETRLVIVVSRILDPSKIEYSTNFRSSVDVSRLVLPGDLVCKINDLFIENANICLSDFIEILESEFTNNNCIEMTVLRQQVIARGELNRAKTVLNAIAWKEDQEMTYALPRNKLRRKLDSIWLQLLIFSLIITDLILFAMESAESVTISDTNLFIVSMTILCIYSLEISLRIYAIRPSVFFKDLIEILDLSIVVTSFVLSLIEYSSLSVFVRAARSLRILKILRLIRSFRLCIRTTKTIRNTPKSLREMIRMNKQGYHSDEFDLDLCYITENVIAMSLPSLGIEKLYRNPISEVVKFLDVNHGDHYMIFDLCLERSYDASLFHNRVTYYKFQDHGVPTICSMLLLCKGVSQFLDLHSLNCVAIHCKGGKGRTGTMCCAWLLYKYRDSTPSQAIDLFAKMRTNQMKSDKYQGIETYSQRRYVHYFDAFLNDQSRFFNHANQHISFQICEITVGPIYDSNDETEFETEFIARIIQRNETEDGDCFSADHVYQFAIGKRKTNDNCKLHFENGDFKALNANICVMIIKQNVNANPIIFASFWIHTYFMKRNVKQIIIPKLECDKLHKDTNHKKAPENFNVQIDCVWL